MKTVSYSRKCASSGVRTTNIVGAALQQVTLLRKKWRSPTVSLKSGKVNRDWRLIRSRVYAVARCFTSCNLVLSGLENVPQLDLGSYFSYVIRKFAVVLCARGENDAFISLKTLFVSLRRAAVQGSGRMPGEVFDHPPLDGLEKEMRKHILHQLSRVGRALPLPNDSVKDKSLRQHVRDLTTRFKTAESDLEKFRQECRKIFSRPFSAGYHAFSTSSSVGNSVLRGGQAMEIKKMADALRAKMVTFEQAVRLYDRFKGCPLFGEFHVWSAGASETFRRMTDPSGKQPCDVLFFGRYASYEIETGTWEEVHERLFAVAACWLEFTSQTIGPRKSLPRCKQVSILERGWKVRIVTPGESAFLHLCGLLNSYLLDCVKSFPPSRSSQLGKPVDHLDWSSGRMLNLVRSADLTSATDLMPHDLLLAGVGAISLSSGMPGCLEAIFERAVGPHLMMCSVGGDQFPVVTCRGTLMGNPVSWPLLNAYTSFLHSASRSDGWYAIVGDDYIGCHTRGTNARWNRALQRTGGAWSPPKDLLSPKGWGVLAEELLSVPRRRVYRTVSIRAAAGVAKDEKPLWSYGPSLVDSLAPLNEFARKSVVAYGFGQELQRLRGVGIDPFAPRWLGGGGFPGGSPSDESLRLARGLNGANQDTSVGLMVRFLTPWSDISGNPALCSFAHEMVPRVVAEFATPMAGLRFGYTVTEVMNLWISVRAPSYVMFYGAPRKYGVKLKDIGSRVAEVREDLRNISHWVSGERIRDPSALFEALLNKEPRFLINDSGFGRNIRVPSVASFHDME